MVCCETTDGSFEWDAVIAYVSEQATLSYVQFHSLFG
jgi:hypothetical protein